MSLRHDSEIAKELGCSVRWLRTNILDQRKSKMSEKKEFEVIVENQPVFRTTLELSENDAEMLNRQRLAYLEATAHLDVKPSWTEHLFWQDMKANAVLEKYLDIGSAVLRKAGYTGTASLTIRDVGFVLVQGRGVKTESKRTVSYK